MSLLEGHTPYGDIRQVQILPEARFVLTKYVVQYF